ncbi:uncharacterized protein LOC110908060 isoform X1 [Helianthus annuus]|nr:uncharacterized protein LOC110908060 isoform X1 [Helianthus annuus]XP_035838654.1 uncharacterized protein LOC110908060 isoform X1 [Helianthus annuus]
MSLKNLPNLVSLFVVDNVVELPQLVKLEVDGLPNFTTIYPDKNNFSAFLKSEVKVAKLEKLKIIRMEKLKQIWAPDIQEVNEISMLREIEVERCDSLVNLFPTNSMRKMNHLERLIVKECGSLEMIFNIDLDYVRHEVEQVSNNSSLRSIGVFKSSNLREVWRTIGDENNSSSSGSLLISGFEALERIYVESCTGFRSLFTPSNTNVKLDMRALTTIIIRNFLDREQFQALLQRKRKGGDNFSSDASPSNVMQKQHDDNLSSIVFPGNLLHSFHYLQRLDMMGYDGVEVVFEIESPSNGELVTTTNNQLLLPNLQDLSVCHMERMTHVWKCNNWNKFLTLQKQSSFHNLTTISVAECPRIKYLFSPLMAKFLTNLKKVYITSCDGMEEIVSKRDDKDEDEEVTTPTYNYNLFPYLHSLGFYSLRNLKRIGGSCDDEKGTTNVIHDQLQFPKVGLVSWSLCQYSREIRITLCDTLSSVIPSYATREMNNLKCWK